MEIKKILWPTDFSSNAGNALDYVVSLVERYGAEIHVLYVIEDLAHHPDWYGAFNETRVEKVTDHMMQNAEKRIDQICTKYLNSCPLYIRHVAIGDPAIEILKLVETEKMDMVIMASQGGKGQFPFGSVTEKVVKNAPVPVVTIPANSSNA